MNDLSPERWQQVDALFAEALDHPPDVRTAFLRRVCGSDAALYRAVNDLLDKVAEAEEALGESVTEFAVPLLSDLEAALTVPVDPGLSPGHRVGPYRLIREVGRGGMGTVYLAERADDQFRKRVALKLVKRGMDTDEILRRFRYERQILAQLEHPGVARLYDGGVSDDGRPYLVMEYVEGRPIDAYCDATRQTVEGRLDLFAQVGEAVQYAHRNLVVHRDLKPSNILVTGEGTVKLLDFGIAKLLDAESELTAPRTRTGWRVMTPEYAAPEQVRGAPVTTATDVYALGAVLYELLTGRRPFEFDATAPHETEAAILEQRPVRPSTAATQPVVIHRRDGTTETTSPVAIGATRSTTPVRLQRRLRGDLDTIVLKALRKEPERRYASAAALLDDLARHRAGHPIAARTDSLRYRTAKFVRRHRVGAVATLAFVLVLSALAAFYTTRIARERDRAQASADRALATLSFMETLFEEADPDATLGDTLTVFELLDRGAAQSGAALQGRPTVQAAVDHTLGRLYLKLGEYGRAGPLLERVVTTWKQVSTAPGDAAEATIDLAHLRMKEGDQAAADSLFREALAAQRARPGRPARVAATLTAFGTALEQVGRYEEAEVLLQEALALLRPLRADHRAQMADAQFALATIRLNEGQYAESERLFREVLATRRTLYGSVHSKVAGVLNNLGNLLYDQGDYEAAEPLLREALAIRRRLFGAQHPAVSETLNNLALVPYARGDYASADSLLRASLQIVEQRVGREHRAVGMTLNNIGWIQMRQGDLDGAEATFREALRIMQRTSGSESADAALLLGNVGVVLQAKGDLAAAEPFFREALAVRRQVHGPKNMHVAWRQFALAEVLRELGRYHEAETLHRQSVVLRRTLRDAGHHDIARGLGGLGGVLLDRHKYAEAEAAYAEALAIYQILYDPDHDVVVQMQSALGACLTGLGRLEDAESLLLTAYDALVEKNGIQHADTQVALQRLIALYTAWDQPDRAASYRALRAAGS